MVEIAFLFLLVGPSLPKHLDGMQQRCNRDVDPNREHIQLLVVPRVTDLCLHSPLEKTESLENS